MGEVTQAAHVDARRHGRTHGISLAMVVVAAVAFQVVLGLPLRVPRIFGDELIYWELSRAFAWTGHFAVRGGGDPGYGVVYPAAIAVAHRLTDGEPSAYVVARAVNSLLFSLAALPVYAIAQRIMTRPRAIFVAALSVFIPSVVYTSTIMTENVFYPAFLIAVLAMLRALERPTTSRQLIVVAAVALVFLVRAQAVVLLPAYALAAIALDLIERKNSRVSALRAALRTHAPVLVTIGCAAAVAISASAIRGGSFLGPYHVLVSSYSPLPLLRWALVNVADIELYVGVIPLAAFFMLLIDAISTRRLASLEQRRLVVLTAVLGAALLSTVAALSTSKYGLGRVHERNLFCVAPLLLIVFFAWLEGGLRREYRVARGAAVAVALLPLATPPSAVGKSGIDALALVWWHATRIPSPFVVFAMTAFATALAILFLRVRRTEVAVRACVVIMFVTLAGAELKSYADASPYSVDRRDAGWIDQRVGTDAGVVAIVAAPLRSKQIHDLWTNEFFNRSVRNVLSTGEPLPDGLPVERMVIAPGGCVRARPDASYAVVDASTPLEAPVVARNAATHSVLFRLQPDGAGRCLARLNAQH